MSTFSNGLNIPSVAGTAVVGTGTGFSDVAYSSTPGASKLAQWDANSNISANNVIPGYATTVTVGGNTFLTVASAEQQYFTGSTTQSAVLPVTSTLVLGQSYIIVNNSSGVVTVKTSGGTPIQAMAANTQLIATVILTSGTTPASWNTVYSSGGGSGSITLTGDAGTPINSSTLTIYTDNVGQGAGSSVLFTNTGTTSLLTVSDSSSNTIIGHHAGNATLSGARNVGLGSVVMANLTSGNDNCGLGVNALLALTTGLRNISIGTGSLDSLTTTSDNIGIGNNALTASVADTQNLGIGTNALQTLNGANGNTAVGYGAGSFVATGAFNAYFGWGAGGSNTGAESSNIYINASGVIGDSHTMRLGTATGTSDQYLNKAFISGINGNSVSSPVFVTIDSSTDQLGTIPIPSGGFPWTDEPGSFSVVGGNGYFIDAAATATLPTTPPQGTSVTFVLTSAGAVVIQAGGTDLIQIGNGVSSAGGTATATTQSGSSLPGTTLTLTYQLSSTTWFASLGFVGYWTMA